MKNLFLFVTTLFSLICFSQEKHLKMDEMVSDSIKRKILVEKLNEISEDTKFELDNKTLVVITSWDFSKENILDADKQSKTFYSTLAQLLNQIHGLQNIKKALEEDGFKDLLFKTNVIYYSETRRYHYKFDLIEIKNFPENIDVKELYEYVVIENKNKNIVHVKNSK